MMLSIFRKKKTLKIQPVADKNEIEEEQQLESQGCHNCENIIIGGGIINSSSCKKGVFNYSKFPPKYVPETCTSYSRAQEKECVKIPENNGVQLTAFDDI